METTRQIYKSPNEQKGVLFVFFLRLVRCWIQDKPGSDWRVYAESFITIGRVYIDYGKR